jgi:Domain of unknown function (DUF4190)
MHVNEEMAPPASSPPPPPPPQPYVAPPPPWGYPPPPPSSPPIEGFATTGMVLGIVGLVSGWIYVITPILGVIFSGVALKRISDARVNQPKGGKGMAIAGLICGVIGTLMYGLMFAIVLATRS